MNAISAHSSLSLSTFDVMAIEQDLKIFISWSGDLAREITKVLRDWLPKMFDHIDPWASDVDIDAGMRGLDVVADRLDDSAFGIIVPNPRVPAMATVYTHESGRNTAITRM